MPADPAAPTTVRSTTADAVPHSPLTAHLTALGAVRTAGRTRHFGAPRGEAQAVMGASVVADLCHLGSVRASGRDAAKFLQAQLTNDVEGLSPDRHVLAAWCDPKGRMQVLFRVLAELEDRVLLAPAAVLDQVVPRLDRYRLRAKVVLERLDPEQAVLGLGGAVLGALLPSGTPAPEAGVMFTTTLAGAPVICLCLSASRLLVLISAAHGLALWQAATAAGAVPVGADAWAVADIAEGLPQVYAETVGEFVPQMANVDRLDGVSFSKGCYPGQEIVARTHYLGRIKRRMYPFALSALEALPDPGTAVMDASGTRVGQVVEAGGDPSGAATALCVVRAECMSDGTRLTLDGADGAVLTALPLPYAIEADTTPAS